MGGYIDSRTVLTLIAVLVVAGLVLLLIVAALLVRVRNDPKDVFGWGWARSDRHHDRLVLP